MKCVSTLYMVLILNFYRNIIFPFFLCFPTAGQVCVCAIMCLDSPLRANFGAIVIVWGYGLKVQGWRQRFKATQFEAMD